LKFTNSPFLFRTSGTSSLTEITEPKLSIDISPPVGWPKDHTTSLLGYRASKAALNIVVRDWCRLLKEDKVKVFDISPGFLATGLVVGMMEKSGAAHPSVGELVKDVVEGKTDDDETQYNISSFAKNNSALKR
jgi:NAD(P)-dependent dehydrogenase (short-subunit alcohol dehydrogenase family)